MAVKYRLQDIPLLQGRDIFVDANVLIYLFWPTGSYRLENAYAKAVSTLLKQKNRLCIDLFVISEVINSAIREEKKKAQPDLGFKEFRNSSEGVSALEDIHTIVRDGIFSQFSFLGKSFTKEEVNGFLIVDTLDFVDKCILAVCRENNCVLLTNDKDFKSSDIDILTANPNLLN